MAQKEASKIAASDGDGADQKVFTQPKPLRIKPQQKVVRLPVKADAAAVRKTIDAVRPKNWLTLSALLVIALPTLLVSIYMAFIASDRYAVETQFAVRGQDVPMLDTAGLMGALGGAPTQTTSDSYIVADYLVSTQLVAELDQLLDLRAMYDQPGIDLFSRLNSSAPIEDLAEYWARKTQVYFDSTKSTITLEVSAYTPDEARRISEEAMRLASLLVNRLSEESRADALRGATADVERAEFRLRVIREEMQSFREQQSIADPITSAGSAQELITQLQAEISRIETELTSARSFMNEDAPSIVFLNAQKRALENQLVAARSAIGEATLDSDGQQPQNSLSNSVARMISGFEELETEREFAQQAYVASMASLERARAEADRKQRYLAVFVNPRTPELATYPLVIRGIFLTLLLSALAWVLGVLVFYGVKEHAA